MISCSISQPWIWLLVTATLLSQSIKEITFHCVSPLPIKNYEQSQSKKGFRYPFRRKIVAGLFINSSLANADECLIIFIGGHKMRTLFEKLLNECPFWKKNPIIGNKIWLKAIVHCRGRIDFHSLSRTNWLSLIIANELASVQTWPVCRQVRLG